MGVWTEVTVTHTSKGVSLRKLVRLILDGEDLVFQNPQPGSDEFYFRFENGGIQAAKNIQKILDEFKKMDKNAKVEMKATIQFFA